MREPRLNTQALNIIREPSQGLPNPQPSAKGNQLREKLEGETESEYVQRLTDEYKAKMSDATPPALFDRAVTFIRAMASKAFEVPASDELQAQRLNICFSCEHFQVSIDQPEQVGHCAACGCSKNKLSSLALKAKISLSGTCPKGKWDNLADQPLAASAD